MTDPPQNRTVSRVNPNVTIVIGTSALTRHLVHNLLKDQTNTNRIDAETDPHAAADLHTPLIPGTHTHIENLHALSDAQLKSMLKSAHGLSVSGRADKLTASARRLLTPHATLIEGDPKRGKDTETALKAYAEQLGVHLSRSDTSMLNARNTIDRSCTLLEFLSGARVTEPGTELLAALSSHDPEAAVPWTITGALDKGNFDKARDEISRAEAIPTLAYLHKRAVAALLLSEGADTNTVTSIVPSLTEAALRDGASLAKRHTPKALAALVRDLAHADTLARTGNEREALIFGIASWLHPGTQSRVKTHANNERTTQGTSQRENITPLPGP